MAVAVLCRSKPVVPDEEAITSTPAPLLLCVLSMETKPPVSAAVAELPTPMAEAELEPNSKAVVSACPRT